MIFQPDVHYILVRMVMSGCVGALLHISGSSLQLASRNSLAAPVTLGLAVPSVSIIILVYMITGGSYHFSSFMALGLLIIFLCLWSFAKKIPFPTVSRYYSRFEKFLLVGLTLNLFLGAVISCLDFYLQAHGKRLPSQLWFGSLKLAYSDHLYTFFPLAVITIFLSLFFARSLRTMFAGPNYALSLGTNVPKLEFQALSLSLLATTLVILNFGIFAFMGLLTPLLLRQFYYFKVDPVRELFTGAFIIGLLFSIIDYLCYTFPVYGAEFPVGLISSVAGPIVFILVQVKSLKKR